MTFRVEHPKFRFTIAYNTCRCSPQPLFAGLVTIFLLTVCLNIFNFFVLCRLVCTNSNKTGHTLQRFPNEANLKQQWVKFVQAKRADFVELFKHSVVCSSHFSSDCNKKGSMVEMGLQKKKKASSWCCTDDSGPARSKLGKKRPTHLADGEDLDVADRTEKRPRKIFSSSKVRGQQNKHKIDSHGNLSHLLKDYG